MCLIADILRLAVYRGERPRNFLAGIMQQLVEPYGLRLKHFRRGRYDVLLFIGRVIPSAFIDLYHPADPHRVMDDLIAAPVPYGPICQKTLHALKQFPVAFGKSSVGLTTVRNSFVARRTLHWAEFFYFFNPGPLDSWLIHV